MKDDVAERALQLITLTGVKELSTLGATNYNRWKNIERGLCRLGTQEIGLLCKLYPYYALWLATGMIQPECGHSSPEYDQEQEQEDPVRFGEEDGSTGE